MYFDASRTRCDGPRSDKRASRDSPALSNKIKTKPILSVAPSNRNLGFFPVRILNPIHGFLVPRSHTGPPMANKFGEGVRMPFPHVTFMKNDINIIRENMARKQARIDNSLLGLTDR